MDETGSASASACKLCPAGTTSTTIGAVELSNCVACEAGKWSNTTGSSEHCTDCGTGKYMDETGSASASACKLCPAGTTSTTFGAVELSKCVACEAGKWSNTTGSSEHCTNCDKGYYNEFTGSNSTNSCVACPAGTIGTEAGQVSSSLCIVCPTGKYSDELAFPGPSCTNCAKGYYNTLTGSNSINSCVACPKGTIGKEAGQTSSTGCEDCETGRFSHTLAFPGPICDKCGMGSYQDLRGQPNCKKCPLGSLGTKFGQVTIDDCEVCPVGEFSTNSSLPACSLCEEGWTTAFNQTEAKFHNSTNDCKFAAEGFWLEEITKNLIECPNQDTSCAGYNTCNEGYAGYLCADCSPEYYHLINGKCASCPAEKFSFLPHILVLGAIFLLVLILALNLFKIRTRVQKVLKSRTPKVLRILFSVGKAVSERASKASHNKLNLIY